MEFNYNRLKAERVAKGFTVQEMADALGITKGTYSKKENGKITVTVEDFSLISNKLGIPIDQIGIFFSLNVSNMATSCV
ncbi:helix-turn-helix domain-containing protein [Psychrobacillus psychrodurans]|uniref:helix-turn-helix domain-containing protein n=1 Tax=Psychrobacillus psychrodurans TaxID=126157 RepID=UPI001F4EA9C2|nr:helix-turn-helix transcriptional regulator [Psychrobacillus psychrodurans]MCK1996833.1 helix-turn-helix domain-containing protein [Psychrobacillus psychrodurans]